MTKTNFSINSIASPLFIIRIVQLGMAIIIMGISAAAVSKVDNLYDAAKNYIEEVLGYSNVSIKRSKSDVFSTFTSVWTILANLYLMLSPLVLKVAAYPPAFLVVELLSNIFWFISWIYLATYASDIGTCGNEICHLITAATVLTALSWPSFVASSFFVIRSAIPYFKAKGWNSNLAGLPGGYFPVIEGSAAGACVAANPTGNGEQAEAVAAQSNEPQEITGAPLEKTNSHLVVAGSDLEAHGR